MKGELPLLTLDLVRRLERLVAPEPTLAPVDSPDAVTIVQFGRTIATKARGGRPSNKVYCFGPDDLPRLPEILTFYESDALEPTFYLTPAGFCADVAIALSAAGFAQREFEQAILYGVPSTELGTAPKRITIERVTADSLEEYIQTNADGFEFPPGWREAAADDLRRHFTPNDLRFLARFDGEPAAVAGLRIRDHVASLGGGATTPRHRNKGCHLALVRHRLDVAYLLGCTLVIGAAAFGSGSFRNQQRAGLRFAYLESGWRRDGRQSSV
jgi:acetyltransferase (GNAT) family protein